MMKTTPCKKYQSWLAAKVFGDLNAVDEQKLQAHLTECARCRMALGEMEQTLTIIDSPRRPEMPEHFWEGYWYRLVERMEKEQHAVPEQSSLPVRALEWLREKWASQPLPIPLTRTAGILALLVLGIVIGHYWWPQDKTPVAEKTLPQPQFIQTRADQWLERSKILLLGIMNEDIAAEEQIDFSHQRRVSRSLLTEARALNRELDPAANRQLMQLINQLELILLQIANMEAEHDLAAVELVREGIAREGILLKINITEMMQQQQQKISSSMPGKKSL